MYLRGPNSKGMKGYKERRGREGEGEGSEGKGRGKGGSRGEWICRTNVKLLPVRIMRNVAQMFFELHLKSPATGEWPSGHSRSLEMGRIDRPYYTS